MDTGMSQGNAALPEVCRVGIRVPPFWPEQPAIWFHQIEGQFALNGVTADTTKYNYVMSQLEPKYALEVQDIITSPPATEKYETLKGELIRRLSASEGRRIQQLLEKEEMGDRTPSQFLRHMQNLAGQAVPDKFLGTLWTGRLPSMIRAIVSAQPDIPLNKLAQIADQIHEGTTQAHVASVAAPQTETTEAMRGLLEEFKLVVSELTRPRTRDNRSTSRHRSRRHRGRSGSRGRRRSASPRNVDHCWYHQTFGTRSTKCRQPCTFDAGNDRASR
ncbi:uncharacterized protein LOC143263794 [Megalopta genalis]|uniref:uncharacterized protein LOC143263794 n=1 Tax=Megalopta genalis TaxID=115081 RepID=UPI003FD3F707